MRNLLIVALLILIFVIYKKLRATNFKSQNIYLDKSTGHILENAKDYTGLVKIYDSFINKLQDLPLGYNYFYKGLYFGFSGEFIPIFKRPCPYIFSKNYQKDQVFTLQKNYQKHVLYELTKDKILSFEEIDLLKRSVPISSPTTLAKEIILTCEDNKKIPLFKTLMFYANGVIMLIDVKNKHDATIYNLIFDSLGTEFNEEHKFDFKDTNFLGYPDILEFLHKNTKSSSKT